jgi:hypothetical protein
VEKPFPDGWEFGCRFPNGLEWAGKFTLLDGGLWKFAFEDEKGIPVPSLTSIDLQPKQAVLNTVAIWRAINGGAESEALRYILNNIDAFFDSTGAANPGTVRVEEDS